MCPCSQCSRWSHQICRYPIYPSFPADEKGTHVCIMYFLKIFGSYQFSFFWWAFFTCINGHALLSICFIHSSVQYLFSFSFSFSFLFFCVIGGI
ncbi:hypothetical protein CPSG_09459 [Coccidioides posadasii str. Silveira]|uniref:Uncharacterized protein n=1 Tax=Coccidioides posadasii (strain RMSCC 757 / Silveira) TaxID=443226 RepID=E9DI10_COCPS|nr:hypothetical protein CPSG_09459 [Coccidioides posadasii str. Silveira]